MSASYRIPKAAERATISLLVRLFNALRESLVSTNIHYTSTPEGGLDDPENPSPAILTVASAAVTQDVDAIVESFLTSTSADEKTGAELDGADILAATKVTDYVTVKTASQTGAYNLAAITVTGELANAAVTDALTLTQANGNETVEGDQLFDVWTISSVAIAAMAAATGHIEVGRAFFPELCVRANRIKGVLNAHFRDTLAHGTAVSAQITTANATTPATLFALLTACKAAYTEHLTGSNVHANNDSTNTVSAADATTFATSTTLANELRTDIAAHIAASLAGGHLELV